MQHSTQPSLSDLNHMVLEPLIRDRIASFKQVVKDGDLRLHPVVTKLVDKDVLEKMGAKQIGMQEAKPETIIN